MADPLAQRLGYLLKHVHIRFAEQGAKALEPLGITGRQLAVLVVLAAGEPLSQLEAAGRLGIDRTTMVALVDELEELGLVERRKDATDRRKNIVELTDKGHATLTRGNEIHRSAEKEFLAPLSPVESELFLRILQALNTPEGQEPPVEPF
jgi:DNA-binding MarR family transcriptional regulator